MSIMEQNVFRYGMYIQLILFTYFLSSICYGCESELEALNRTKRAPQYYAQPVVRHAAPRRAAPIRAAPIRAAPIRAPAVRGSRPRNRNRSQNSRPAAKPRRVNTLQSDLPPGLSGDWGEFRPPGSWGRAGGGRGWRQQAPEFDDPYFFEDGLRKKRISEIKFEEYMRRVYGNEDYEEDPYRPHDLNGREVARPGDFPHVAVIGIKLYPERRKDWKCTGTLISEYFVLTAAHCTNIDGQAPTHVKIGDINLRVREDTVATQRSRIERIFTHPKYNAAYFYFDIALIKMIKPVVFTLHVRPARIWIADEIPYNVAFVMGYGATRFGQAPTELLTYFNLTLIGNKQCSKTFSRFAETPNGIIGSQLCALDVANYRDTCQGDSGGPLQLNLPGRRRIRYYVIGITSYGLVCGSKKPSVYTKVSSFLDWLEEIVWEVEINGLRRRRRRKRV